MKKTKLFFLVITFNLILSQCIKSNSHGILHIHAEQTGTFEIYNIIGDSTLQFVSKQLGQFNEDLHLEQGTYLVLADCSYEIISIQANQKTSLIAHTIEFKPPVEPSSEDIFSIQCNRYEKTFYRQSISNRFRFHILNGSREMLVGMVPLKVDPISDEKPQKLEFNLAAIQFQSNIHSNNEEYQVAPYFVSPNNDLLAITQPQKFNSRQYLLPGYYQISLNGTSTEVNLLANEVHTITPGYLNVQTPIEADLDLHTKIKGYPLSYEINNLYKFSFNRVYPLLPGQIKFQLEGSNKFQIIEILPNELKTIQMRSLLIELGCSIHEWECLGKREVMLYEKNQPYPYLESFSDVPILFNNQGDMVSIEGAKGLKYILPNDQKSIVLKVGKVIFRPKPIAKNGYVTDLVRLESLHEPYFGYSDDILAEHVTTMTLIAGNYVLVRYTSLGDTERTATKQIINIKPGETTTVEFNYYLNESKALKMSQSSTKHPKRKKNFDEPIKIF